MASKSAQVLGEGPRRRPAVTTSKGMHTVKIYKEKHGEHDDKVAEYCEDFADGGKFGAQIAKETSRAVFVEYPIERHEQIMAADESEARRRVTKPGNAGIRGELQPGEYGFIPAEEKAPDSLGNLLQDVQSIQPDQFTQAELDSVGEPLQDPAIPDI